MAAYKIKRFIPAGDLYRLIIRSQLPAADGEPWFVAADIAGILRFETASDAVRGLEEDEKGMKKVPTLGGEQNMMVITEAGLYTVLVRSNKAIAKPFRRWVTHEVLPSIRKHGA